MLIHFVNHIGGNCPSEPPSFGEKALGIGLIATVLALALGVVGYIVSLIVGALT